MNFLLLAPLVQRPLTNTLATSVCSLDAIPVSLNRFTSRKMVPRDRLTRIPHSPRYFTSATAKELSEEQTILTRHFQILRGSHHLEVGSASLATCECTSL